ncbi:MAG: membrane-bound lytic murein transglycosylase F [Gammaproteobacteria bacterium]|jgi:membrane-bound lytic murein transglycosylase F
MLISDAKNQLLLSLIILFGLFSLSLNVEAFVNRGLNTVDQVEIMEGDFNAILASGKLRILVQRDYSQVSYLPRVSSPLAEQLLVAEAFAANHGLRPELVLVNNFSELIPALEAGKGDIIIANLTINDQRLKRISFSVPVDHVKEQVIVSRHNDSIQTVADLNGKKVMVNVGSTFWHALQWLKKNKYPDIDILAVPDHTNREQLLDILVNGDIDATIMDDNLVGIFQGYRDDIKVAVNFSSQRNIGWGIRKNAIQLVSEINRYLQLEHAVDEREQIFSGDFDQIIKRKTLRVLLRNNSASYFLYRGELMGFEYEIISEFARFHNLRLKVVVPPGHNDLYGWLLDGKADLAMGFLEPLDSRRAQGVEFTQPYHFAARHIIVHRDNKAKSVEDLNRQVLAVRLNSSENLSLAKLQQNGANLNIRSIDDSVEIEQLIQQVGDKTYDATLADEHLLEIALADSQPVRSALKLETKSAHSIAIRKQNQKLQAALNKFIKKTYKGEYYNVLYAKYFKNQRSVKRLAKGRIVDTLEGQISPYDKLIRKYANQFGFDWRLITAQMYQESGFDPQAKSPAGATGLMQLMPRTASSIGVKNIKDPAGNINGGVKYLSWLRDRFDAELPIGERLWFSLAAYNAGLGHVHDARRLTRQLGLDNSKWFGNTEKAMLLLSKRQYSSKARYGYVNGREPVKYVREIKERFEAYINMSGSFLTSINRWQKNVVQYLSDLIYSDKIDSSFS